MADAQPQAATGRISREFGHMAALALVLGVALAVRLIGITWGLPDDSHLFSYHPDEFHSLRGALSLALGDPNPHFFNYGSLYLYLVGAASAIANPLLFSQIAAAAPGGPMLPEALHQWTFAGRIVTVILAVGTVAVVYATARRIWGHREGLAAGLLLGLAPLHVLHAHYATVDVPGAFFTALACYFAVAMVDEITWRNVLWAGAAAGLAASVKYSGGAVIAAPVLAWGVVRWRERGTGLAPPWTMLAGMAGAAFAAFALTSPYTFLDWSSAWRDISFEMEHMRLGDDPAMIALWPSGAVFQFTHLAIGTGFAMVAAAGVGLAVGLMAKRDALWALLAFGVVAFAMSAGAEVRYARYAMPLLPLVAVFAAGVVSDDFLAMAQGRIHAWALAGGASVLIVGSVLTAGAMDWRMLDELVTSEPRAQALEILDERVPEDGTVGLITEPWFYHPPVDRCNGGKALRGNPLWAAYRDPVRELAVLGLDPQALRAEMPDAVVVTGFEVGVKLAAGDEQAEAFMDALEEAGYREVAAFRSALWGSAAGRPKAQDLRYPFPWIELWVRGESR
jgi:hypothetical protein